MTDEIDALVAQVLAQYQGPEHAALHALIASLVNLVETLTSRVEDLEAEAGRHSGNLLDGPFG